MRLASTFAFAFAALSAVGTAHAQTAPPPIAPPPGSLWVWVTLPAMGREARLEAFEGGPGRSEGDDEAWRKLCFAPCGLWIPSTTRLRVDGSFRTSAPFTVPRRPSVRLEVDPVRTWARITGLILMPVGAGYGTIGLILATSDEGSRDRNGTGSVGRVLGVFGLAVAGTGLALFLVHRQTSVDFVEPSQPGVALGKGVWLRPDGIHF